MASLNRYISPALTNVLYGRIHAIKLTALEKKTRNDIYTPRPTLMTMDDNLVFFVAKNGV